MTQAPPSTHPICFVDTETGGLRSGDRPWEVAIVRRETTGTESRHLLHVADFRPADADPKALELAGFYDRHPLHTLDALSASAALLTGDPATDPEHHVRVELAIAAHVERLVRGTVIVGCNPAYDVPRLTAMLERHGFAWTAHYRPVCATTLAAGRLGLVPPVNNAEIGARLGVARNAHGLAHTGMADALYARDLYDAALRPRTGLTVSSITVINPPAAVTR